MFLVDTNVLIDVAKPENAWFSWSSATLRLTLDQGLVFINPIVYAELSVSYRTPKEADEALASLKVARANLPFEAGFLAGKAFTKYRRRGGVKTSPLPDFYIGAHAAVAGLTLITRAPRRIRVHFPTVRLLTPE